MLNKNIINPKWETIYWKLILYPFGFYQLAIFYCISIIIPKLKETTNDYEEFGEFKTVLLITSVSMTIHNLFLFKLLPWLTGGYFELDSVGILMLIFSYIIGVISLIYVQVNHYENK